MTFIGGTFQFIQKLNKIIRDICKSDIIFSYYKVVHYLNDF